MRLTLLAATLIALATSAHAQKIYKYTDENGNVIFSQSLPTGVKGQEVRPKVQKISDDDAKAQLDQIKSKLYGAPPPPTEPTAKAAVSESEAAWKERNKKNCEVARRNLDLLSKPEIGRAHV